MGVLAKIRSRGGIWNPECKQDIVREQSEELVTGGSVSVVLVSVDTRVLASS